MSNEPPPLNIVKTKAQHVNSFYYIGRKKMAYESIWLYEDFQNNSYLRGKTDWIVRRWTQNRKENWQTDLWKKRERYLVQIKSQVSGKKEAWEKRRYKKKKLEKNNLWWKFSCQRLSRETWKVFNLHRTSVREFQICFFPDFIHLSTWFWALQFSSIQCWTKTVVIKRQIEV